MKPVIGNNHNVFKYVLLTFVPYFNVTVPHVQLFHIILMKPLSTYYVEKEKENFHLAFSDRFCRFCQPANVFFITYISQNRSLVPQTVVQFKNTLK